MSMDLGAFVDFLADCSFKMPQFSPGFNSLLLQMVEFILEIPSFSISLMSTFSSFCGKPSDLLIVMNTSGTCWLFTACTWWMSSTMYIKIPGDFSEGFLPLGNPCVPSNGVFHAAHWDPLLYSEKLHFPFILFSV